MLLSACLLFILIITFSNGDLLPCFTINSTWHYDDVINVTSSVPSHFLCQDLCGHSEECLSFTWNTDYHLHYPQLCTHYRSTGTTMECADCISGPRSCSCSEVFACDIIGDNMIGMHPAIATEVECQSICYNTEGCTYYTWFGEEGEYSHVCFIFSSCPEVDETCQYCFTGPPECSWTSTTSTTSITTTTPLHHSKEYAVIFGGTADKDIWNLNTVEIFHPDGGGNIPAIPNIPFFFALGCTFWTKSGSLIAVDSNFAYSWSSANPSSWIQHGNSSEDLNGCSGVMTSDGETALIVSTGSAQHPHLFSIAGGWSTVDVQVQKNIGACAVGFPEWERVINTGGYMGGADAVLFNETGHVMGHLPSMIHPRFEHGCSRVSYNGKDGMMVVAGYHWSTNGVGAPLETVEFLEYSGQDSTWLSLSPLPYAAWGLSLKTINGKSYIFGGHGNSGTKDTILRLEEDLGDFWLECGKMEVARWYPGVAITDIETTHPTTQSPSSSTTAIASKHYTIIIGGRDSHGNGLNTIEFFSQDPVNFPDIPNMPEHFNAGCSFMSTSGILTIINSHYTYTWGPGSSGDWVKQESPPESMHGCTGVVTSDGDTIFIASSSGASHLYLFSPPTGWTTLETKISHNVGACAIGFGERGLVVNTGGAKGGTEVVLMSELGQVIGKLPSMHSSRDGHACAAVELDGRLGIMVAGGIWNDQIDNTVEFLAYPGEEIAWQTLPSLPNAIRGAKLVVVDEKVFLFGGETSDGVISKILEFNGLAWIEIGEMDRARFYHGAVIGSSFD